MSFTDNSMLVTTGKGLGGDGGAKEARYMVTEDGLTLGGGHTIQYTDQLS